MGANPSGLMASTSSPAADSSPEGLTAPNLGYTVDLPPTGCGEYLTEADKPRLSIVHDILTDRPCVM